LIPNETFCLSVDWANAGEEIMKNTDVSKSKKKSHGTTGWMA